MAKATTRSRIHRPDRTQRTTRIPKRNLFSIRLCPQSPKPHRMTDDCSFKESPATDDCGSEESPATVLYRSNSFQLYE